MEQNRPRPAALVFAGGNALGAYQEQGRRRARTSEWAARRGHIAPQFGTFQGHLRAEDNPKMSSGRSARASCICWSALITFRQMAAHIWEKLAGEDVELHPRGAS